MNPQENSIETSKSINWIEDGILICKLKGNAYLTIEDARAITKVFRTLSDKPLPHIVDFHTTKGISSETRNYFASDLTHITTYSAAALWVSNSVARVLANFFLGLNKPLKPTKLFNSKEEALHWLKDFL